MSSGERAKVAPAVTASPAAAAPAQAARSAASPVALAVPAFRRGQKLAFSFDEDELTLATDAVQAARLAPGTALAVDGLQPPAWWWSGLGLANDPKAALRLRVIPTAVGPAAAIGMDAADIDAKAPKLHGAHPARTEAQWQDHRLARDGPDTEADFPLGAFVSAARHEQVLVERLRLGTGTVGSWTAISAGAAPTEFARLQQAAGTYHVVLVAFPEGKRTVGLWADDQAPTTGAQVRPVLRRLFRTQGAWRHGVKFVPR